MSVQAFIVQGSTYEVASGHYTPVRPEAAPYILIRDVTFTNELDVLTVRPPIDLSATANGVRVFIDDLSNITISSALPQQVTLPSAAFFNSPFKFPVGSTAPDSANWIFNEAFELASAFFSYPSSLLEARKRVTWDAITIDGALTLNLSTSDSEFVFKPVNRTSGISGTWNFVGTSLTVDLSDFKTYRTRAPAVGEETPFSSKWDGAAPTLKFSNEYSLTFKKTGAAASLVFGEVTCPSNCNPQGSSATCASTTRCLCTGGYTGTNCDVPTATPTATPTTNPTSGTPTTGTPTDIPISDTPTTTTRPPSAASSLAIARSVILIAAAIMLSFL